MHLTIKADKIWLWHEAIDFRKAVDGLCMLIASSSIGQPSDGLYIFYNKAKNRLKLIGWQGNGFVLIYKRLEKNHFTVNQTPSALTITEEQLKWLLAGFDWHQLNRWNQADFNDYFLEIKLIKSVK